MKDTEQPNIQVIIDNVCFHAAHFDATPDEEYPLRILRAYRENYNTEWASDYTPSVLNVMNTARDRRAEILDRAIAVLEKARKAC